MVSMRDDEHKGSLQRAAAVSSHPSIIKKRKKMRAGRLPFKHPGDWCCIVELSTQSTIFLC
jgi:hypothetical protein